MEDAVKLKVNPPTLQRAGSAPELKLHGAVIVTGSPTLVYGVKSPPRLLTVGDPPAWLSHPVTWVAVLTDVSLSSAPPLIVTKPLICAALSVMPALTRATAVTRMIVLCIFVF